MEGKLDEGNGADGRCSHTASEPQGNCCTEVSQTEPVENSGLFASRIGAVPWSLWDVIRATLLFLPIGVVGSLGLGFALARAELVSDTTLAFLLGSALLPVALLAAAWVFGIRRHKASVDLLGFRSTSVTSLTWLPLVALSIGMFITAVYALLVNALGIDILVPDQGLEEIAGLDGFAKLPTFAIVGLLAPFAEEVFFRGFLLAALVPVFGGLRGAVVSSSVFSVAHLNIGTLFPIFVMGMLLAWLYLRTGSVLPSFVAHAAQNILALIFLEIPFDAPAAHLYA